MDMIIEQKLPPFLKWAGGKRWLVGRDLGLFPQHFNTYLEPFLGSAAVFFHLLPQQAVLSDVNQELIDTYSAIRDNWSLVRRYLVTHQTHHSSDYYYQVRAKKPRSLCAKAARMIYLNRTCWNGLYRVNLSGQFNVPVGTKTKVLLDTDNFEKMAQILSQKQIRCQDFEVTIDQAGESDFVFIDPPYTVKHNYNGFIKYNETLFTWADQVRLKESVDRAVERGAQVLVLNAAHQSIKELYDGYDQELLSRNSVLAGKASFRGKYEELAIMCGY